MLDGALIDRLQPLFREKSWAEIQRLVEPNPDPAAQYLLAWSLIERGKLDRGLPLLKGLFAQHDDATLVGFRGQWETWRMRQSFGATNVLAWGLLPELVKRGWASMADYDFQGEFESTPFAKDWVSPDLRSFMNAVPASHRHTVPWQLGGAMGVSSEFADPRVREFARETAARLTKLTKHEQVVLEALRSGKLAPLADLKSTELRRERERARPLEVFRAELNGVSREMVLELLGLAVATVMDAEPARAVCADLDAFLQIEDLWQRIPKAQQRRGAQIERVLFRATPMRVVDCAIARLKTKGMFGTLARKADATGAALVWFEGTKDEALATVPDAYFKDAVAVLMAQ